MTTATEVMPTLREIEQGLRERLAQLSSVAEQERAAREKAKAKVAREAIRAGDNNSIGESLDDLLDELGLESRPMHCNVTVEVEFRQRVNPYNVRDIRLDGTTPWTAYQNLQGAWLHTTAGITVTVDLPRNSTDCGCTVPITDDVIAGQLGVMPESVERVGVTVQRCTFATYPHTSSRAEECACVTVRATHAAEQAATHDDPLVQPCVHGHTFIGAHRHIFYPNGEVDYIVRADYIPDAPGVVVPGWYGTGTHVGQPIPGTVDTERVQECAYSTHPDAAYHLHVRFPHNTVPSYSGDLTFVAEGEQEVLPGVFSRDADRVGGPVPTT